MYQKRGAIAPLFLLPDYNVINFANTNYLNEKNPVHR